MNLDVRRFIDSRKRLYPILPTVGPNVGQRQMQDPPQRASVPLPCSCHCFGQPFSVLTSLVGIPKGFMPIPYIRIEADQPLLSPSIIRKGLCLLTLEDLHSFHSPYSCLLFCSLVPHVISCFLLSSTGKFLWKYGEVHLLVRGSSPSRTGKFTFSYGEVHSRFKLYRSKNFKSVRGSSLKLVIDVLPAVREVTCLVVMQTRAYRERSQSHSHRLAARGSSP